MADPRWKPNVTVAAVALLLLAPICVFVAIAVKLTSPGPVFYTQTRVGLDRRWNRTTALRERRVCTFTPAEGDVLVRAGPRLGEAARLMARCLRAGAPP